MQSEIYEMGKGGLTPVSQEGKENLKRGQVLHWGGNMGYTACDSVIVERLKGFEDRIKYKCIRLKESDSETDYKPYFNQIQAFSIKKEDDKSLWHKQHYFITDKTISEEEIKKLEIEALRLQEEQTKAREEKATKEEQNKKRFNPDNRLIIIELCYNDSDGMTDYYNPCSVAKRWVLKEIPEGKRLLSILKREKDKYKSLKGLEWSEHRENHSMNKFGYSLTSGKVNIKDYITKEIKLYRGGTATTGFFMVSFGGVSYDGGFDFWNEKPQESTGQEIKTDLKDITIKKNEEKQGLEIYFKEKPDRAVLELLKSNGFRWGRFNKCWYKRYYAGIEEEIQELLKGVC